MYAKNDYCVQIRTKKGWRYLTEYNSNIDIIYAKYQVAKKRYKQARIINSTDRGLRVANIS
ncbi:hypothetical protein [Vallitalea guaymasensis]|uniref:hypothetical protein n=1 Tax=Vallitalea guaymasensis TaxID=1185412 RepID=UPI000DE4F6D5|nr:hypothetical protein [Vallitalea guaymasensis]